MTPVFVDFETFWSQHHSLTKMNPIAYVMHPDTEIISMAIKFGNHPTDVVFGEDEIAKGLKKIDWSDKLLIAHNMSEFDAMILAWRFGISPKMWGCTLAMAAPIHQKDVGGSLKSLVEHYGLGVKDNAALMQTKGKHLKDFTRDELDAMRGYNKADTEQCAALFYKLLPQTPPSEMKLIDMTIRMWVEPQFEADIELMKQTLEGEIDRKRLMLLDLASMLGIPVTNYDEDAVVTALEANLGSAAKFGKLLRDLGVEVPMKPSPSNPDKMIAALAKTDEEFVALKDSDDPLVAAAASARLGVKSTILESRLTTMISVAEALDGAMPVPLKYYSAHTGRWGGCLVADTEILCYETHTNSVSTKRIVDVLLSDLVWDGEDFVAHEGVAFSGYSEVVFWDGVTGTEDHVIFTDSEEISLREAMQRQLPIKTCRSPSQDAVDAARIYARNHRKGSHAC